MILVSLSCVHDVSRVLPVYRPCGARRGSDETTSPNEGLAVPQEQTTCRRGTAIHHVPAREQQRVPRRTLARLHPPIGREERGPVTNNRRQVSGCGHDGRLRPPLEAFLINFIQLRIAQGTDPGLERPGRPRVAGQGAGQGLERPAEVGLKAHRDGIGLISKRVAEQPTEATATSHLTAVAPKVWLRGDEVVGEALMIALRMIVGQVLLDRIIQGAFTRMTICSSTASLMERTNRSQKALRFGLRGGRTTGSTPWLLSKPSNIRVNLVSRSWMRDRFPRRNPS